MSARDLLDIAVEYVNHRNAQELMADAGQPSEILDEIASRWEAGLRSYVESLVP